MILKGQRVVIRREKPAEKVGRIWIPPRAQKRTMEGVVVTVGDKVQTIQVGQRVLFPSRAWSPFPWLGDDTVLVWERDVMGVLE